MSGDEQRVLGVDPGLAHLGIGAVVERGRDGELLLARLVRTRPGDDAGLRLAQVHAAMLDAIDASRPDAIAIEGQYFHRQREASFKVGQAVGVVLLAAHARRVPVHTYGPLEVKQTLVGSGRADKAQVAYMVRALLGRSAAGGDVPHHVSDALALALTHLARRRLDAHAPPARAGRGGLPRP
ncbi:MAG: crossover junction endodeoxyribonuclease RuvC [Trueperaceae bacterium]|nr:crossover junction endodeoxyribonuclease RuvC [Trueperaceae bacterium]